MGSIYIYIPPFALKKKGRRAGELIRSIDASDEW
jgi:hypothetical protein